MSDIAFLPHRSIIRITGEERRDFLEPLLSCGFAPLEEGKATWGALLTPQGKFLHDLFIFEREGSLFLEIEHDRREDLIRRLRLYKLRRPIEIIDDSETYDVAAAWGEKTAGLEPVLLYEDPRHQKAGWRMIFPKNKALSLLQKAGVTPCPLADYDQRRICLGLPDGSRDLQVDKAILMENGFDELGGIDWKKGCFIGQELTARTRYRGLVKKRLLPLSYQGAAPREHAPILQDGKEVGDVRSIGKSKLLALMRLTALENTAPLEAEGTLLTLSIPDWVKLPEKAD